MHQLHPQERPRSGQVDREEVIKIMVARSRLALQACLKLLNFYRLLNHSLQQQKRIRARIQLEQVRIISIIRMIGG